VNTLPMSGQTGMTASSSRNSPTRRLLKELETWRVERGQDRGIERLGPLAEGDLFSWEAVINGREIGGGYEGNGPRTLFVFLLLSPRSVLCHCDYASTIPSPPQTLFLPQDDVG
jgi:hypothetical protein